MTMKLQELQQLLDKHGAELASWPDQAQQDAGRLLASSKEAQQALENANELNELLTMALEVPAPRGLKARILSVTAGTTVPKWLNWLAGPPWKRAMAACVPLVLGFAVGFAATPHSSTISDEEIVFFSSMAFDQLQEFADATED